jgi:hypothetical protein
MTVRACPLTLIRPEGRSAMPKYVIERDIPGAGNLIMEPFVRETGTDLESYAYNRTRAPRGNGVD